MAIHPDCFIIALHGGKGGVGKSLLAANLAITTLLELRTQVLLIDADQKSCGDQNVILGLRPQMTIKELTEFRQALSPTNIAQVVARHPSGLSFLGAVKSPDDILSAQTDLFVRSLEALSRIYKYIFIDVGNDIDELQRAALQLSTLVLTVTVPDLLTLNQTRKSFTELSVAGVPSDCVQVIVNRANLPGANPQLVSQILRKNPLGIVPNDENQFFESVQRSSPLALQTQRGPIQSALTDIVRKMSSGLLQKLKSLSRSEYKSTPSSDGPRQEIAKSMGGHQNIDPRDALKMEIHSALIRAMEKKKGITETNGDPEKERKLKEQTQSEIVQILDQIAPSTAREERQQIIKEVLDEALGLGPLEKLLSDDDVTEIMVNGAKKIFIEKGGKLQLTPVTFTSNLQLKNVIKRIMVPLGRIIDEKTPYQDARLADGSRVNAIIEPLSIDGPALTIRKFRKDPFKAEDYIRYGSTTEEILDFLKICVQNHLNIVISGGTGSGKTTLLNVLSSFIPSNERVITIEDAAELQLYGEHVVRLETRPANMEGSGAITIRDLIKNSLRMRPERIIVGETRDGAALDMLQAMNTGHDGSMTTTHSNSARECISRLETLCMMAGMELPQRALREQIASAVHLIIQISRMSDGSRKIKSVTEVAGMQGDTPTLSEIFRFKEEGFDKNRKIIGSHQATGLIPTFIEKLEQKGVQIPRDIFSNKPKSAQPQAQSPAMGIRRPALNPVKKTGTGGA